MGKTHPETLRTILYLGATHTNGLKDFAKAEELFRLALDCRERTLGKGHESTIDCVKNLVLLVARELKDKEKTTALVARYPELNYMMCVGELLWTKSQAESQAESGAEDQCEILTFWLTSTFLGIALANISPDTYTSLSQTYNPPPLP